MAKDIKMIFKRFEGIKKKTKMSDSDFIRNIRKLGLSLDDIVEKLHKIPEYRFNTMYDEYGNYLGGCGR